MILEEILEIYEDESFLIAEGFDEAIIGVDESEMRLIYSVNKCLEILIKDMSKEEAIEHFEFNISSGYIGEKKPIFCYDNF